MVVNGSSGTHIVLYTVDEGEDIFIVRVRHGREDWARDE